MSGVIKSGMLSKRAQGKRKSGRTNWRDRYFVLTQSSLAYYQPYVCRPPPARATRRGGGQGQRQTEGKGREAKGRGREGKPRACARPAVLGPAGGAGVGRSAFAASACRVRARAGKRGPEGAEAARMSFRCASFRLSARCVAWLPCVHSPAVENPAWAACRLVLRRVPSLPRACSARRLSLYSLFLLSSLRPSPSISASLPHLFFPLGLHPPHRALLNPHPSSLPPASSAVQRRKQARRQAQGRHSDVQHPGGGGCAL